MPNPLDDGAVYTLDDLKSWESKRPGLPPSLAVLGHPVAHSVSPQMHNAALAELAKTYPQLKDWRYFKFDVTAGQLEAALELLKAKNFKGTNVTVPHKNAVAEIFDPIELLKLEIERRVKAIRSGAPKSELDFSLLDVRAESSVNTVVFGDPLRVYSTDRYGLALGLKRDLQVRLKDKIAVVLGTGGAATEAARECMNQECAALGIGGRDVKKRQCLREFLHDQRVRRPLKPEAEVKVFGFDIADTATAKKWPDDVVLINATTLGMKRDDPLPFDVSLLGKDACVFDMVYNRQGPTKFVEAARARDLRAADGLGMLVWQGAKSLTIWIKAHEGIDIAPESIAQTMMDAACKALDIERRTISN